MSRSEIPSHWTPLQVAQYLTVHEFRRGDQRGAAALGPMLGKSPAVLSNEVNPEVSSHKPGLEDSIPVQLLTGDYRILQAYNQALHHVGFRLPETPHVGDVELLTQFAEWQRRLGETCGAIHRALEDRRIEEREVREIRRTGQVHMEAFLGFLARLEQLAEGGDE